MSKIKVINHRDNGNLFHYAHFICDCLLPEVVAEIYNYENVIREKSLHQTIGNFSKIYEVVMSNIVNVKNIELLKEDFDKIDSQIIHIPIKNNLQKNDFQKFRNYIFNKFNIIEQNNEIYPEILLIKRGNRKQLINDDFLENKLQKLSENEQKCKLSSGKERREIDNIELLEKYLNENYQSFQSIYLEELDFETQVKYFYHAKVIIAAHGAGLSNMLFCKHKTIVLEITCNSIWPFFDKISNILQLKHYKLKINKIEIIKNALHIIFNK